MGNPFWFWGREELFNRLMRRFLIELSPRDPTSYLVHRSIQPITNADALLRSVQVNHTTCDLTPAAGTGVPIYTVPQGKRATLICIRKPITTGSATVRIRDPVANENQVIVLNQTAENLLTSQSIPLDDGWIVETLTNNNGADGARTFEYLVEEENAY